MKIIFQQLNIFSTIWHLILFSNLYKTQNKNTNSQTDKDQQDRQIEGQKKISRGVMYRQGSQTDRQI